MSNFVNGLTITERKQGCVYSCENGGSCYMDCWACNEDNTIENNIVIYNLTPHTVNIVREDLSPVYTINPEENSVRCPQETKIINNIGGIPITSTTFGEVEGLPEEKENVYYIVSRLVLNACKDRHDLLVPNELVRDGEGHIIGCKSLANN